MESGYTSGCDLVSPAEPNIIDSGFYKMIVRLRKMTLAAVHIALGLVLGILLLEPVLRSNTTLLPRGIAAPLPVDPPLTDREYEVRYADADIFFWEASLIRPPEENLLEARVHWRTDEFGFPNPAPVPAEVDLVILGRSYSMGAQAEEPWPDVLRGRYGIRVLNLSQTGSGLREKRDFFLRFGLPRNPRYVIIEILPPFDILNYGVAEPWVVRRAVIPFAQNILRRLFLPEVKPDSSDFVYPLRLELAGGSRDCVFYSGYLSALGISMEDWSRSSEWANFRADLAGLVSLFQAEGIIPIVLFIPTKETVYIPLTNNFSPLESASAVAGSWIPAGGGLVQRAAGPGVDAIRANAAAGQGLIREFASLQSLCLVDPTASFAQALRNGSDPFMRYDTHWSTIGHAIVAREVAAAVESGACR